jgi:hypothetical protein
MKKIVITEAQAKKLVDSIINEQGEQPQQDQQPQQGEIRYHLGPLDFIVKDGNPFYLGEDGQRNDLPKLSQIEIIIHPKNLERDDMSGQMSAGNNVFGIYEGEATQLARNLARKMVGSFANPDTEKPRGPGFEVIVFDDLVRKVPIWVKVNVLSAVPAGGDVREPELIKEKEGGSIMFAQTRTKNFLLTISSPLGVGRVFGDEQQVEKEVVFFCVSYNDDTNGITKLTQKKGATNGAEWLKNKDNTIVGVKGPYRTREEALKVCQPELPELLPFGDFFANNVSKIKLSPSMPFVKQLKEYFDAGGKLSKITIKASASSVPAGHMEADPNADLWKDVKTYDNAATGTNDDRTGNLQLTKARAYNLYAALIQMFPQLTNIPRELIASGSIGIPFKGKQKPKPGQNPNDPSLKGDDPNDPKYANFRRVDLILNK